MAQENGRVVPVSHFAVRPEIGRAATATLSTDPWHSTLFTVGHSAQIPTELAGLLQLAIGTFEG